MSAWLLPDSNESGRQSHIQNHLMNLICRQVFFYSSSLLAPSNPVSLDPVCESYLLLCETLSDDFQLPMQLPSLWHTPLTLPDYLSLLELYSLSFLRLLFKEQPLLLRRAILWIAALELGAAAHRLALIPFHQSERCERQRRDYMQKVMGAYADGRLRCFSHGETASRT